MTRILSISLLLIISFNFKSCKQAETNGIQIGQTLYSHQDYDDNKRLREIIDRTLNHDEQALIELINFNCGGGAGCYDLGFILTQIIYRIGETDFNQMILNLNMKERSNLISLIRIGLEYGDHNKDGRMDNRKIEIEFSTLNYLSEQ